MVTFEVDLQSLRDIEWSLDSVNVINESMGDIVSHPLDFALFVVDAFKQERQEIIEQIKGILFFMVYRYPEIFILIHMYLKNLETDTNKDLNILMNVYSFYIKEN